LLFGWLALSQSVAAPAGDPWLRLRSADFELFTTAGERVGREVLRQFERVHSFFGQAFPNGPADAKPVRLIVFRTDKEYAAYRPNEVAAAYFQAGADHDDIVMTASTTDHSGVAVHEYTHLMVHQSGRKVPVWFNEGLAELYSNLETQGDKVMVGRPIPGRAYTLTREPWISVRQLVGVSHDSSLYNEKAHAGMFYAESWLLVHMLNLSNGYQPRLTRFTGILTENDTGEAFEQAFGKTLEDVDKDLRAYQRQSTVSAALLPIRLPKDVDAASVETGVEFDAKLALAELLTDTAAKRAQAREAYEELARAYPGKWPVEAGWAQYYWREGDIAAATEHYAKAAEMGCQDARVLVEYGRMLNFKQREKDAAPVLRQALSLDPHSREAHLELGIALARMENARDALPELNQVNKVSGQEAPRYFFNLAYAYYRTEDLQHARAALEKGRPYIKTAQDTTAYASLTHAIGAYETSAATLRQAQTSSAATPLPNVANQVTSDTEAPRLVHREAPPPVRVVRQAPKLPAAQGLLTQFECQGKAGVLHVKVDGVDTTFTIQDPKLVMIRSGNGASVDFYCGPQKPRQIKVEYQELPDDAGKMVRVVRTLEFF
jgi:tetratricopeptide (TPR) repeat protein